MIIDLQSPYGVNAHLLHDEGLEKLASIGIQWVRIDFDWDRIQPDPNVWDWSQHDRIVATCERLGLGTLAVLAYTPQWASGNKDRTVPPVHPEAYLAFVSEVVRRYQNRVQAWSIWNEPNLKQFWKGSLKQFVHEFWVPGLERVRSVDLDAYLVGPDLSSARGNRCLRDWFPLCLAAGKELLDAVSHHQYDGGDTVSGRVHEVERVHAAMVSSGAQHHPLWVTEIGWDRVNPMEQGRLLAEVYDRMGEFPWWTKTFWYDSHGPNWGLLEPDGTSGDARPALASYARVINA